MRTAVLEGNRISRRNRQPQRESLALGEAKQQTNRVVIENGEVKPLLFTETIELEEELPPNPILLKFLAENKLSEKFGGKPVDNTNNFAKILEEMTPEQLALVEMAQKGGALDEEK